MFVVAVAALGMAGWSLSASADGKAVLDKSCAECHEAGDFSGEVVKGLTDSIKKIAAGQVKHKAKITLSDADITAVAQYMSTGK
jgi:mono/diheme cytochrome c family protein